MLFLVRHIGQKSYRIGLKYLASEFIKQKHCTSAPDIHLYLIKKKAGLSYYSVADFP